MGRLGRGPGGRVRACEPASLPSTSLPPNPTSAVSGKPVPVVVVDHPQQSQCCLQHCNFTSCDMETVPAQSQSQVGQNYFQYFWNLFSFFQQFLQSICQIHCTREQTKPQCIFLMFALGPLVVDVISQFHWSFSLWKVQSEVIRGKGGSLLGKWQNFHYNK